MTEVDRPGVPILALLPSPLLGPAMWESTADELCRAGVSSFVVAAPTDARTTPAVLEGFAAALPDEELVLVPHSNAGLYAPALTARCRVRATVYVDAALQSIDRTPRPNAPGEFHSWLAAKADAEGLLPVWTQWWDEDLSALFPDDATRDRIAQEQRRLPIDYFAETVPAPTDWHTAPAAYLAFGDTYADETARARALGWPVQMLAGEHLEMTHHPDVVARALVELLSELGRS